MNNELYLRDSLSENILYLTKKKKKGKLKRQFSVKRTTSYVREISLLQGNF
mgnify:CR=1 FL=1